jgi:hypothetical protein
MKVSATRWLGLVLAAQVSIAACGSGDAPPGAGCLVGGLRDGAIAGQGDPTAEGQPFEGRRPETLTTADVVQIGEGANLHVSWRYTYEVTLGGAYTECWCIPPPEGRIGDMFFDDAGRLLVFVAATESMLVARTQPEGGWGC